MFESFDARCVLGVVKFPILLQLWQDYCSIKGDMQFVNRSGERIILEKKKQLFIFKRTVY